MSFTPTTTDDPIVPQKWTPTPYMKTAMRFLLERGAAGLFLDPGLRKTSIALASFQVLLNEGLVERMLVIAPLRPAYLVWPLEILKWLQFNSLRVVVLHGKGKHADYLVPGAADVYVINPEGLTWLLRQGVITKNFFDVLCVDESSKFKHTQTERFKLLKVVLGCFKRRWILTGSPAANGLMDLFGQIYLLDLGRALGAYITQYRVKFFAPTGYGGYTWVLQRGAEKRIYAALASLVLRMSEKDYLKLPPLTITDVLVDLPPKARFAYRQMEEKLFAALDDGEARAVNRAVAVMKCRQLANGGIYLDEDGEADVPKKYKRGGRPWTKTHDAKTEAVVELIEELGGRPAIVSYEFDHDLARLREALPDSDARRVVVVAEMTSREQLRAMNNAWNNGKIAVLLLQTQMVHGLNLQAGGAHIIMHSLTYNYEDYDQLIRRLYRSGQKLRVFVHRIVARNTVDVVMNGVIASKKKGQQALFSALRAYRLRRKDA